MKAYDIKLRMTVTATVSVEAKSEAEARSLIRGGMTKTEIERAIGDGYVDIDEETATVKSIEGVQELTSQEDKP